MPKVKKPRIRKNEHDDEPPPPALRRDRDDEPAPRYAALRQRISTYAFGTLVCGAAMVALASWLGGSLGAFGDSMTSGLSVVSRATGMSVDRMVVVGLDPVVEERARKAAGVAKGDSMFLADPYAIKARIEQLDAVASVSVHRFWPDQITIIAETREPMALWNSDGDWRVIDQRGRTFAQVDPDDFMQLPRVSGEGANEAAAALLTVMADFPELRTRMESAERVSGRRWDVTFRGGVDVALPEDGRMEEALTALNLLEARNRLLQLPVTRIDARHPDRFALRPAPGARSHEGV
ncbi:MAG: cell division protein FtsQ/DivIB [Hyphomonadaceae bacterium]